MNSAEFKAKLLLILLFLCESIHAFAPNHLADDYSTKAIVDFWRQQEEEFKLGTERDK